MDKKEVTIWAFLACSFILMSSAFYLFFHEYKGYLKLESKEFMNYTINGINVRIDRDADQSRYVALIMAIDKEYIKGLENITVAKNVVVDKDNKYVGGYYFDGSIFIDMDEDEYETLYHELGHHVMDYYNLDYCKLFDKMVEDAEKEDIFGAGVKFLGNKSVYLNHRFPSEYSLKSCSENFAVNFALWKMEEPIYGEIENYFKNMELKK